MASFPPGADVARGRQAIEKMWKSDLDAGAADAVFTTIDLDEAGAYAIETGTFVIKQKDGKEADRGRYVTVWKKAGSQWLIHRDMWNSGAARAGR